MIAEVLPTGKENAITGKQLCVLLDISSRELMAIVEAERRQGEPICASSGSNAGYYLAANAEEMRGYCRFLFTRAAETMKTYRACKKTAEAMQEKP